MSLGHAESGRPGRTLDQSCDILVVGSVNRLSFGGKASYVKMEQFWEMIDRDPTPKEIAEL